MFTDLQIQCLFSGAVSSVEIMTWMGMTVVSARGLRKNTRSLDRIYVFRFRFQPRPTGIQSYCLASGLQHCHVGSELRVRGKIVNTWNTSAVADNLTLLVSVVTIGTVSFTFNYSAFCSHSVFMCFYGPENKQRLFPHTALTGWFL
jgi:hypothetical protein